jgi:hypothetical protein
MLHLFYKYYADRDDYEWDIETLEPLEDWPMIQHFNFVREMSTWYSFEEMVKWLDKHEIPYKSNKINHIVLTL